MKDRTLKSAVLVVLSVLGIWLASLPDAIKLTLQVTFFLFMLSLYFLPSYVALTRAHPNAASIFGVNLLFGWTVFGWLAVLLWSCNGSVFSPRSQ